MTEYQKRYQEYLDSEHWKQLRDRMLKARHKRCEICGSTAILDVHHKKYALGKEKSNHLTVLCRFCHEQFHKRFQMRVEISKYVFRCVRRRLAEGMPLDQAWEKASQNMRTTVKYYDRRKAKKKAKRLSRTRQRGNLWRTKFDPQLSYYLARDEQGTAET